MHLRMFDLAKHHLKQKRGISVDMGIISPTNDAYALLKPSLSPSLHRLAMIKLALSDVEGKWIICEDWECKQREWVRTLPALRHYASIYGKNMRLLCGADLLDSFLVPNLWSDDHIEEILRDFGIVALPRPGSNPWKLIHDSEKSLIFRKYLDRLDVIDDEKCSFNISSTMVRNAVKEGEPIEHLVHREVAKYIKSNNLYKY